MQVLLPRITATGFSPSVQEKIIIVILANSQTIRFIQ